MTNTKDFYSAPAVEVIEMRLSNVILETSPDIQDEEYNNQGDL